MDQQLNKDELEITIYLESTNKSFDNVSYAYKLDCFISPLFPFIENRVKDKLGKKYENIQKNLIKYISKYKTTDFSGASEEIKELHEKWCQAVEEVCEPEQDLINDNPSLELWQAFRIKDKKSDMVNLTGLYKTYGLL